MDIACDIGEPAGADGVTTELVAAGETDVEDVADVVAGGVIAESTVEFPVVDGATETVPLVLTVGATEPTDVVVLVGLVVVVVVVVMVVGTTYFKAYACE